MELYFSEFSFGYAATEEISRLGGPVATAPCFPNLQQEGSEGFGYDVRIDLARPGVPLFLQFKLPQYITRRRSDQDEDGCWPGEKFFRVPLRTRRPNQHQLLINLEAKGNEVFYVAPSFRTVWELNRLYAGRRVLEESAIVRPSELGSFPEGERHHFSFRNARDGYGYRFSEAVRIDIEDFPSLWNSFHERLSVMEKQVAAVSAAQVLHKVQFSMESVLMQSEHEGLHVELPQEVDLFEKVRYLSRVAFDATFVLVGLPKKSRDGGV